MNSLVDRRNGLRMTLTGAQISYIHVIKHLKQLSQELSCSELARHRTACRRHALWRTTTAHG